MTLTSALNAAMSGLNYASRGSGLVASNIANASTPGFVKRSLSISSQSQGDTGGVRINGIERLVDTQVLADRRNAGAELGLRSNTAAFLTRVEDVIGTPEQAGSLSARLSAFENSLITASSRPDAIERLDNAVLAAKDLAGAIQNAADVVQEARSVADREIAAQVTRLNDALQGVEKLNGQITATLSRNTDTAALMDQRQLLIDEISEIVPVRVVPRDHGTVALFTQGGAILLDASAAELGFDPTNSVTPYLSVDDGTLSGLTLNGRSISTSSFSGPLRGGTLDAQFQIRDELGPEQARQLDAIARDLIERFQDTPVGPGLNASDPGLFTDQGVVFDPMAELGLATRIGVNAVVDPTAGGESWRLRAGLDATGPGNAGDATLLNSLAQALTDTRLPNSGEFGPAPLNAQGLAASLVSQIGTDRLRADNQLSFASAQFSELREIELAGGVDTDTELQNLLVLEQAYAANARVIQTVDEMMNTILGIT